MSRRLIVLRHGESTHNARGLWQGQTDPPLSERGRAQARAAAAEIAAMHPVRVVASDLSRARETGRIVADVAGVPLVVDPAFREIDVGRWAGLHHDEVRRPEGDVLECIGRGEDPPRGGGERVADVRDRVMPAAERHLRMLDDGQCLVLATHGMAGWVAAVGLMGRDPTAGVAERDGLANAHWVELCDGGAGWSVVAWNAGAPDGEVTHPAL